MTTLGFVGLGHMGGNMAARFLAAGYTVFGESRDRRDADELVHGGCSGVARRTRSPKPPTF
jgi:3-hydroxyisobutyrate dehydrogenase-like beta-hydroxyacid dehydrogenase